MKQISGSAMDAIYDGLHDIKMTAIVLEDAVQEIEQSAPDGNWEVSSRKGEVLAHFIIQQAKAIDRLEETFKAALIG